MNDTKCQNSDFINQFFSVGIGIQTHDLWLQTKHEPSITWPSPDLEKELIFFTGCAKLLIENGAKVNVANKDGNRPLYCAIHYSTPGIHFIKPFTPVDLISLQA